MTPAITREAYISVFETWLELLARHPRYAEHAGTLTAALQDRWVLLPEGPHPVDTFCAALEQPLLSTLGAAGMLAIWKSNYLYRRLYMGQEHRATACTHCAAAWSGGFPICARCGNTGWLPKECA
jgi:hypothetical protein